MRKRRKPGTVMKRLFAFTLLALLLFALFSAAGAEEPDPATPTDLECLHENTKTTIFFFDSPAYTAVSAASHRVYGPATVQVICMDCGEILSSKEVDYIEEIRPHSIRKGVCVLCGYRESIQTETDRYTDAPGERTLFAQEDDKADGLLTLTLTMEDLTALKNTNVTIALVRGNTGNAAIALDVDNMLNQIRAADADLYLELAEREDSSVFACVCLVSDGGERTEPDREGIRLRFYRESQADVRVSLAPVNSDMLMETECIWDERGFWSVQYQAEGTYFVLQ